MAGSTTKKVVVQRFERESLAGFVNPQSYLHPGGVELLAPSGGLSLIPYAEIRSVLFVRDFASGEPEGRKVFQTRPKMDGLWVRLRLRDAEILEGILSNNLLLLESYGFTITPPDPYSNHQRVFIPRAALVEVQVLGVVGSPLKTARKPKPVPKEQIGLFD